MNGKLSNIIYPSTLNRVWHHGTSLQTHCTSILLSDIWPEGCALKESTYMLAVDWIQPFPFCAEELEVQIIHLTSAASFNIHMTAIKCQWVDIP